LGIHISCIANLFAIYIQSIRVNNSSPRTTGARLNVFASPTPDLSVDAQLVAQTGPMTGTHKTVRIKISTSASAVTGGMFLVAQLVPTSSRATAVLEDVAPSVVVAPHATQFVAPNVDLTAQLVRQPASPLFVSAEASTRSSATVLVLNSGTTPAVGTLSVSVYASASPTFDAAATLIGSAALPHVKIPSATSRSLNVPLTFPAGAPAASYYLFAVVNPSGAIAESNTANNVARSISPLVITNTAPPGSHHEHFHDHSHVAGGAGVIVFGGVCAPVDSTDSADQSDSAPDESSYIPPDNGSTDTGPSTQPTTDPTTQPTTDPTTQPSDPSSDSSSTDGSSSDSSSSDSSSSDSSSSDSSSSDSSSTNSSSSDNSSTDTSSADNSPADSSTTDSSTTGNSSSDSSSSEPTSSQDDWSW